MTYVSANSLYDAVLLRRTADSAVSLKIQGFCQRDAPNTTQPPIGWLEDPVRVGTGSMDPRVGDSPPLRPLTALL